MLLACYDLHIHTKYMCVFVVSVKYGHSLTICESFLNKYSFNILYPPSETVFLLVNYAQYNGVFGWIISFVCTTFCEKWTY